MRLITAKAWLPLDRGPSPVGVTTQHFRCLQSALRFSSIFYLKTPKLPRVLYLCLSSSSIPACKCERCRDYADQSPFVVAARVWRGLPNNPLLYPGKTTLNKRERRMLQTCWEKSPPLFGLHINKYTPGLYWQAWFKVKRASLFLPQLILHHSLLHSHRARSGFSLGKWPPGLV